MSAPVPPCSLPARRTGLTRRVEELRCALPDDIRSSYAVKANPTPTVVQHFSRQVDDFDVASAGQMTVALDTPIMPTEIAGRRVCTTNEEKPL